MVMKPVVYRICLLNLYAHGGGHCAFLCGLRDEYTTSTGFAAVLGKDLWLPEGSGFDA